MTVTLVAMSENKNVVDFGDVNEISASVNKRPRPQHMGQSSAPNRIEMDEETVEDLRRSVRAIL